MLEDMWETVTDYNAHAKADNCILFIKDIHFSILCHENITGLRLLAPTVQMKTDSKPKTFNTKQCPDM